MAMSTNCEQPYIAFLHLVFFTHTEIQIRTCYTYALMLSIANWPKQEPSYNATCGFWSDIIYQVI